MKITYRKETGEILKIEDFNRDKFLCETSTIILPDNMEVVAEQNSFIIDKGKLKKLDVEDVGTT